MGTFFHILKENKSVMFPRHFLFYDTETTPIKVDDITTQHKLKLGVGCYVRKSYKDHKQKEVWEDFNSINRFWKIVDKYSQEKQSLYIVAHNQNFDFCVVDGLNQLVKKGWEVNNFIFESSCFLVKARKGKKTIVFIDTTNFVRVSLKYIGDVLGLPKGKVDFDKVSDKDLAIYCKRDVEIIKEFLMRFIDFIEERQLCYFRPTIASLAFNTFKHKFMDTKIFIHANEKAIQLERDSYRGGRTEAFRIGKFNGENYYYFDINSQYPYVMRNNPYPTKLITMLNNPTMKNLKENMEKHLVIADVDIHIPKPIIAYRQERLLFPIGSFRVQLCTPELRGVLRYGSILDVHRIALYESSTIFKNYVDYFYGIKQNSDGKYNNLEIKATKLFLNTLYGKFGQRIIPYNENPTELKSGNFVERYYSIPKKKWIYNVVINGKIYRKGEVKEGRDSLVAIPSFVTAYARNYLWSLIELAGSENVYYTDTDSLIVNECGKDRLIELVDENKLGMLKLEMTSNNLTINNVKNYKFGDEIKIKGIKRNARIIRQNTYKQENFMNIKSQMRKGLNKGSHSYTQEKTLKGEYLKGVVDSDGYVHPFIFNDSVKMN